MEETHFIRLDADRILPGLSAHQCAELARDPKASCVDRESVLDTIHDEIGERFLGAEEHVRDKIQPRLLVAPPGAVVAFTFANVPIETKKLLTLSLDDVVSTCRCADADPLPALEAKVDWLVTRRLSLAAHALASDVGVSTTAGLDENHLRNALPHVARVLARTWAAEAEREKPSRSFTRDDLSEMYNVAVQGLESRVPPFVSHGADTEKHTAHDLARGANSVCLLLAELEEDP